MGGVGDNVTVVGVDTKEGAAAMVPMGDGLMEAVVDTEEAAVTAIVGDGAMMDGFMAELLVRDGVAPDLLTMGHPSSLRRHTMPL